MLLAFNVGGGTRAAVWWRQGAAANEIDTGDRVDAAFELSENTFSGVGTAQMVLRDLRPAETGAMAHEAHTARVEEARQ